MEGNPGVEAAAGRWWQGHGVTGGRLTKITHRRPDPSPSAMGAVEEATPRAVRRDAASAETPRRRWRGGGAAGEAARSLVTAMRAADAVVIVRTRAAAADPAALCGRRRAVELLVAWSPLMRTADAGKRGESD